MKTALLIIDPQNDFHDIPMGTRPGAYEPALAVPGACEDSARLSDFIRRNQEKIDGIYVTMDTHADYDIGHPMFWQDAEGNEVNPFTPITHDDIVSGRYRPVDSDLKQYVLDYTQALEEGGRFTAMVWPTHCVKHTFGWSIYKPIMNAIKEWEATVGKDALVKEKGTNQLTEHYGAFAAEYEIEGDPETQLDTKLLDQLAEHDVIIVGGQALSHCVGESVRQMTLAWPKELTEKIVLLRDTTSAVPGFGDFADDLVEDLKAAGIQVRTTNNFNL